MSPSENQISARSAFQLRDGIVQSSRALEVGMRKYACPASRSGKVGTGICLLQGARSNVPGRFLVRIKTARSVAIRNRKTIGRTVNSGTTVY
jgi:hypothetical protein